MIASLLFGVSALGMMTPGSRLSASFFLAGFHMLMGRRVLSWGAGAIREVAGGTCRRRIQLRPPEDPPPPFEVFRQVRAGREYSSGHPAMQALNPAVVGLMLSYERQ